MLERDRAYLVCGRQLSAVIAFSLIKTSENNELTKNDIQQFLTKNGYQPSIDDVDSLYWRLDHNKDGRLTYSDFCQIYDDSALVNIIPQSSRSNSTGQDINPDATGRKNKLSETPKLVKKKSFSSSGKSSKSTLKLDQSKISAAAVGSFGKEDFIGASSRLSFGSTSSKGKKPSSKKMNNPKHS